MKTVKNKVGVYFYGEQPLYNSYDIIVGNEPVNCPICGTEWVLHWNNIEGDVYDLKCNGCGQNLHFIKEQKEING